MAEITASMVKELRSRTGLGMMECKKALEEAGGDMNKAEDLLRVKSGAKASKVARRGAAGSTIRIHMSGDRKLGGVGEGNCEAALGAKEQHFARVGKGLGVAAD